MGNTNTPFGMRPVRHMSGGVLRSTAYPAGIPSAYAVSIYEGDPVTILNTGVIGVAAAGDALIGSFAGVQYTDSTGKPRWSSYWPAATVATDIIAYVYDDPNIVYKIRASSAATLTNIGENADIIYASGTSTNGQSVVKLDATAASSRQLRVLGKLGEVDNDWSSFAVLEVRINENLFNVAAGV